MKNDKIIEYISLIILNAVLFFNLFVLNIFSNKIIFSIYMIAHFLLTLKLIKLRSMKHKYKKNVIMLVTVLTILYLIILYVIGIFAGFYKNPIKFNLAEISNRILPISLIVITAEAFRYLFVVKNKKNTTILTTIALILTDVVLYINIYDIFILEDLLALAGFIIIPSVTANFLCNYMVKMYGYIPNIIYRFITIMYTFTFPILPDIYIFLHSVIKILYPYVMYIIIDYTFSKDTFKVALKDKSANIYVTIVGIILSISLALLISCKFKYGMMVVGSSSMTGSINKGDAIIFEKYEEHKLEEGQVIVFLKEDIKTIHRIDDIQTLNGQTVYYTKGDANQRRDDGYIIDSDIIGMVKFKLLYIGWPTIWVNNLFKQ